MISQKFWQMCADSMLLAIPPPAHKNTCPGNPGENQRVPKFFNGHEGLHQIVAILGSVASINSNGIFFDHMLFNRSREIKTVTIAKFTKDRKGKSITFPF